MFSNMRYDVAIIGAGPTGLTVANFLGKAGLNVLLIERNETTVREPRAVSIDDESLRTIQALGLAEAVIAECALDYGSRYFTPSGKCFLEVEPKAQEYGFPRRNAFVQPLLEATLRKGLDRYSNVVSLFSHECLALEERETCVILSIKAPDTTLLEVESLFVVGCDGARSMVRKTIGAKLSGATYQQPWLIIDLASTKERLRQTRVMCDPRRPFITLPGPNGIRRYEFLLHPSEADLNVTEDHFVRSLLAASGPDSHAEIVRKQVYTFHARLADVWRRGRTMIAGDAAHLSPPFAGQGMNSGIRDAHNVSWKLNEVIKGRIGEGVLDTYRSERAPHALALINLAIRMGKIMMPSSSMQAMLMQSSFRLMRFTPRVRSYFAEMKYKPKPYYVCGFLDQIHNSQFSGRMIPQPVVETFDRRKKMLDDLLGNEFSLIVYGDNAQDKLSEVAELNYGVVLSAKVAIIPSWINSDQANPLFQQTVRDIEDAFEKFIVGSKSRCIMMIVRPDRYLCAMVEGSDAQSLQSVTSLLIQKYSS